MIWLVREREREEERKKSGEFCCVDLNARQSREIGDVKCNGAGTEGGKIGRAHV